MSSAHQEQVDRNFEAFAKLLPGLLQQHAGKHALMKDGAVEEIFDTVHDAYATGSRLYPDGLFSIQEITDDPVDLGFFSHAVG